jgi:transposase-like protein
MVVCGRICRPAPSVRRSQLKRENFELRRANEILKAASVFFATELDADRTK